MLFHDTLEGMGRRPAILVHFAQGILTGDVK